MKFSHFLICMFILPVFGLIACHSDKSLNPDVTPQAKPENPGIIHDELNDIKTIDIIGSISLDFEDLTSENYSRVESKCRNNYLEEFSNVAKIDNTESLPVKDILPFQVFTPNLRPKTELFCDFKISILNHRGENTNNSKIVLKDIKIENIENYSNFELPLKKVTKTTGKPFYILKKDLKGVNVIMPTDKGQVFTLCQESGRIHPFDGWVLPITDFFEQKLFDENNLSLCRLLIHQKDPEKNWVTEAFFIQNQEPKITYQYKHNYTAGVENRWDGYKMGVLTLSNEGLTVAYLNIIPFPTKVSVMAVYSNFSKKGTNHRSDVILDLNVSWIVDDGISAKKDDKEFSHIYKLEPGQSINLSLKTHDGFLCDPGQPVTTISQRTRPLSGHHYSFGGRFNTDANMMLHDNFDVVTEIKKSDCKKIFYLSGILYHLHAFPKITYNLFSTMNFQRWQSLHPEKPLFRKYGRKFSTWVPNYQASRYCSGLKIKHEIKNYPTQNKALNHMFECRLDNH